MADNAVDTPWLRFLALPRTAKLYLTGGISDSFSGTFFYLLVPCAVVGFIALSSILSAVPAFKALLRLGHRLELHARAAGLLAFAVGVMLVHDAYARFLAPYGLASPRARKLLAAATIIHMELQGGLASWARAS